MVTSADNTFTLTENGTPANISLSAGNYTITAMITELQSKLDAASPLGRTYTVSVPARTDVNDGKISISYSGTGGATTLTFTSGSKLLAFLGATTTTTLSSDGSAIKLPLQFDLRGEDVIILHSDLVLDQTRVLGIFPVNTPSGASIVYQAAMKAGREVRLQPKHLFNFTLSDENNNNIDLNGIEWTLFLTFYKDEPESVQERDSDIRPGDRVGGNGP